MTYCIAWNWNGTFSVRFAYKDTDVQHFYMVIHCPSSTTGLEHSPSLHYLPFQPSFLLFNRGLSYSAPVLGILLVERQRKSVRFFRRYGFSTMYWYAKVPWSENIAFCCPNFVKLIRRPILMMCGSTVHRLPSQLSLPFSLAL